MTRLPTILVILVFAGSLALALGASIVFARRLDRREPCMQDRFSFLEEFPYAVDGSGPGDPPRAYACLVTTLLSVLGLLVRLKVRSSLLAFAFIALTLNGGAFTVVASSLTRDSKPCPRTVMPLR
jgi:hypothetical protein